MKKYSLFFLFVLVLASVSYGQGVPVDPQTSTYFDLIKLFQTEQAEIWKTRAFVLGQAIFWPLVGIQFAYYGIGMMSGWWTVPNKSALGRKAMIMGIFLILLLSFYQLENIVFGLRDFALYITGRDGDINEMELIGEGIGHMLIAFSEFEGTDQHWFWVLLGNVGGIFTHGFVWVLGVVGVTVGYTVMALQYAFITIEIIIATAVSPIFVALGASEQSRGSAEGYIEYLFELGFKAFFFYMVFGICKGMLENLATTIDSPPGNVLEDGLSAIANYYWEPFLQIGFVSILTVVLLAKIPSRLSQKATRKLDVNFEKIIPKS